MEYRGRDPRVNTARSCEKKHGEEDGGCVMETDHRSREVRFALKDGGIRESERETGFS